MRDSYDCIVVGGGPGGAWAAKHAAQNGARVLLLEKDREVGIPVRCAEAVGETGLKTVVDLRSPPPPTPPACVIARPLCAYAAEIPSAWAIGIGIDLLADRRRPLRRNLFKVGAASWRRRRGVPADCRAHCRQALRLSWSRTRRSWRRLTLPAVRRGPATQLGWKRK